MILVRHGQSEFNAAFNRTRIDPGIPDPKLTDEGRIQVRAAAEALKALDIRRLITSPYTRALQTAEIIAEMLAVPVEIDPSVRERMAFICDIGTPAAELARQWPALRFDHLAHPWWPSVEETEDELHVRGRDFCGAMAKCADWRHVAVVTHWAFIRGLTGLSVANGELVAFDPETAIGRVLVAGLSPA